MPWKDIPDFIQLFILITGSRKLLPLINLLIFAIKIISSGESLIDRVIFWKTFFSCLMVNVQKRVLRSPIIAIFQKQLVNFP